MLVLIVLFSEATRETPLWWCHYKQCCFSGMWRCQ